jgi:HAD superfamily hydrolase (TIGR01450 family)
MTAVPWVLDLDGVVWLADTPIPGAADAVARLRAAGEQVTFVTNNSNPPVADVEAKLASFGIPAAGAVVTSAMVVADLVRPGERVLLCAGPGVREALIARGAVPVEPADGVAVDTVIVGFHREFDYERMRIAADAVRAGARLLATNDDATYPTPLGPIPGAGSILAGIERASGATAVVAGKPYEPIASYLRGRLGGDGIVVGDRPDTDGRLAVALGWRFALVLTGVTRPGGPYGPPLPDIVAPDLAAVVDQAGARDRPSR